jgi:DNA-binding transcriptional regulator YiaG
LALLLGIAQRTVLVDYADFKQRFSPRKPIPTEVKTLGDYLLLKRVKADLSQPELALKTGYTVRKIKMWEHDRLIPTATEWKVLSPILNLGEVMRPTPT